MPVVGGQRKNQSLMGRCNVAMLLLPVKIVEVLVDKDAAIRIITSCARQYDDNLKNKNLVFLFDDSSNGVAYIETLFLRRNFMHLTGVVPSGKGMRSTDFYDISMRGQLSPRHFELHKDGSSDLKLSVLSMIMNIHKTAKMVGDYNLTKSLLITEKIVGTVTACLGFVRENGFDSHQQLHQTLVECGFQTCVE